MTKKGHGPKVILVVDPAIRTTESEAYNNLAALVDELRLFEGLPHLSLRFWLPVRGSHGSLDDFLGAHPEVVRELAGCISLGSAANVTDAADHPWMIDYGRLLDRYVQPLGVPFLGVCFGHQFVAHRSGAEVGYAGDPKWAGMRYHAYGRREVAVTSLRTRILLASVDAPEWNRRSPKAQDFKLSLAALRGEGLTEAKVAHPLAPHERAAWRIAQQAPARFDSWARHWQIVKRLGHPELVPKEKYMVRAMGSDSFPMDGLVHPTLPWFTVQTHPERPMTDLSRRFLLNFLLLCSFGREGFGGI